MRRAAVRDTRTGVRRTCGPAAGRPPFPGILLAARSPLPEADPGDGWGAIRLGRFASPNACGRLNTRLLTNRAAVGQTDRPANQSGVGKLRSRAGLGLEWFSG